MNSKVSNELFKEIRNNKEFDFSYVYDVVNRVLEKGVESFYFECKKWAFKNGYEIVVLAYSIKIYKNGYEIYHTNTTLFDLDMFFKACEWVLDNKSGSSE